MITLAFEWKQFNVSIPALEEWIAANISAQLLAREADVNLRLSFSDDLSQADIDALQSHWDSITAESNEAVAYISSADIEADRIAKKNSAKAKLEALGLTADEVKAILG